MYVLDAGRLDFDISDRLFTLSSSGIVPECIIVGIVNNKNTRERDLTPPFMQIEVDDKKSPAGQGDKFLSHIESELISLIDSSYRTTTYKTITGHSRSGLFVLYTLIEKPDLFNARFCYSTPAWRFDNLIISQLEKSFQKHLPVKSYLIFSVGADENQNILASFHATINRLIKTKPKYLKYDSYLTPLANHQSNPLFSTAQALLSWNEFLKKEKLDIK